MVTTAKNNVICLLGMDGSGKTTHAFQIISRLQKSGEKCRYAWFGTPFFFSYPFMILCRVLDLTKTYYLANGFTCSVHEYYKNKPAAYIWPWIRFIDLFFSVGLRVYVPMKAGFTVVCDRFVPDNLVELMVDVADDRLYKKFVGRLFLHLIPNSSKLLLLDVNESLAFRRKQDLPNIDYLVQRKHKYYLVADELQIPIISAEQSFCTVSGEIVKHLRLECVN